MVRCSQHFSTDKPIANYNVDSKGLVFIFIGESMVTC